MTSIDILSQAIQQFAGLSEKDFDLSRRHWVERKYAKGDFYNRQLNVCTQLGFIIDGVFRGYVVNDKEQERNVFFYSQHQFVVSFKSFVNQMPCDYHTQAINDSTVLCIGLIELNQLYKTSHAWANFGRLLAQAAFNVALTKAESFIFRTPEERYLDLVKNHPLIFNEVPLYHISSYLGIQGPSLSRIRKKISLR